MHRTRWRHDRTAEASKEPPTDPFGRPDTGIHVAVPDHRHELVVEPALTSVGEARTEIRHALGAVPIEWTERAAICGSELVANALRHGFPPIILSVVDAVDHVIVSVEDGSRQPPLLRIPGPADQSGRGMLIIDRIADRWGVDVLPQGKRVWCLIELPAGDLPSS